MSFSSSVAGRKGVGRTTSQMLGLGEGLREVGGVELEGELSVEISDEEGDRWSSSDIFGTSW